MTCHVLISWVFISLGLVTRALGERVGVGKQWCLVEGGWCLDADKSASPHLQNEANYTHLAVLLRIKQDDATKLSAGHRVGGYPMLLSSALPP